MRLSDVDCLIITRTAAKPTMKYFRDPKQVDAKGGANRDEAAVLEDGGPKGNFREIILNKAY